MVTASSSPNITTERLLIVANVTEQGHTVATLYIIANRQNRIKFIFIVKSPVPFRPTEFPCIIFFNSKVEKLSFFLLLFLITP